jgi:hypothetical protein
MQRRWLLTGAISLMTVATARAQEAAPSAGAPAAAPSANLAAIATPSDIVGKFAARGQLAVSLGLPLTGEAPQLGIVHASTNMGGGSSTVLAIEPSADYFVAPNLSVGGLVGIRYVSTREPAGSLFISGNSTVLMGEARVGYNLALGETLSLWPRIGIGYSHGGSDGLAPSSYAVPLVAFAPLLWHPGRRFFLGAGPIFTTPLVERSGGLDQPKTTDIGVQGDLGGTFGG